MSAGDVFEWGVKIIICLFVASIFIPWFLYNTFSSAKLTPSISEKAKLDTSYVGAYNNVYVNSLSQFIFSVLTITVSDAAREELYNRLTAICSAHYDPEKLTAKAIDNAYLRYASIVEEAIQTEIEPDFKVSCCFRPYYQNLPKILQYNDYLPIQDIMSVISEFIADDKIIINGGV